MLPDRPDARPLSAPPPCAPARPATARRRPAAPSRGAHAAAAGTLGLAGWILGCGQAPPLPPPPPVVKVVTAPPPECATGTAECDGDPASACETDIDFDGASCGACGVRCGAGERCVFGACRRTGALAVGHDHSCALADGGSARCWGRPTGGQLGDGSGPDTVMRWGAVRPDGLTGAVEVAAGGQWIYGATSCALLRDGRISCWGSGAGPRPAVQRGFEHVVDLAVSSGRACAVLRGGKVRCRDLPGRKEAGGPDLAEVPGLSDAVQVCASSGHSLAQERAHACALRRTGDVVCWGPPAVAADWTDTAELEDGTVLGKVPDLKDVVQISCGGGHDCAVQRDGRVRCWGLDRFGELGRDGDRGLSGAVEVAAGDDHTCALHKDGHVWCWGRASDGRLGNDSSGLNVRGAVRVVGLSDAVHVGAGEDFACASRAGGETVCWGDRDNLGDGRSPGPHALPGVQGARGVRICTGLTCALLDNGSAQCVREASGQNAPDEYPKVITLDDAVAIPMEDALNETFCSVRKSGKVDCYGAFGYDDAHVTLTGIGPAKTVLLGDDEKTTGFVLLASGAVSALGMPKRRNLSTGSFAVRATPLPGLSRMKGLDGNWQSACAFSSSGQVTCVNLEEGSNGQAAVAARVDVAITDAIGLSGYDGSYVVLHRGGVVSAFEWTEEGRLSGVQPVDGVTGAVEVASGHLFACARLESGAVTCWGDNFTGELGTGDLVQRSTPVYVKGLSDAVAIDAAARSACAVRKDGSVLCWGADVTEPNAMFHPVPVVDDPGPPVPAAPSSAADDAHSAANDRAVRSLRARSELRSARSSIGWVRGPAHSEQRDAR